MAKITTTLYGDLAIIPQVAEVPFVETLAFLTDSIESYNGVEQHIQVRGMPRQSFQYQIPFQAAADAGIFNTAWGALRKKWAVPAWGDAQYVGNVTAAANSCACDTVNYDLRAPGLAMFYTGCGQYKVVEITSKSDISINFAAMGAAIKGAYLIPLRVGFIVGDVNRAITGHAGKVEINFQVDDLQLLTPAAPDQYLANDIYYTVGLLDGNSLSTSIKQRQDIIDFDLGVIDRRTPWTRAKYGRPFRTMMTTPAEIKAFKDFAYRRIGKVRPFWMPTFESNLRVKNTGTIVSTLVLSADSYIDYAAARVHIAVEANGVWYPRVISAPVPTGADTIQVTLSSPLNIPANTVKRASYLGLNRLDTDKFEINYSFPKTAECTVRILEVTP